MERKCSLRLEIQFRACLSRSKALFLYGISIPYLQRQTNYSSQLCLGRYTYLFFFIPWQELYMNVNTGLKLFCKIFSGYFIFAENSVINWSAFLVVQMTIPRIQNMRLISACLAPGWFSCIALAEEKNREGRGRSCQSVRPQCLPPQLPPASHCRLQPASPL